MGGVSRPERASTSKEFFAKKLSKLAPKSPEGRTRLSVERPVKSSGFLFFFFFDTFKEDCLRSPILKVNESKSSPPLCCGMGVDLKLDSFFSFGAPGAFHAVRAFFSTVWSMSTSLFPHLRTWHSIPCPVSSVRAYKLAIFFDPGMLVLITYPSRSSRGICVTSVDAGSRISTAISFITKSIASPSVQSFPSLFKACFALSTCSGLALSPYFCDTTWSSMRICILCSLISKSLMAGCISCFLSASTGTAPRYDTLKCTSIFDIGERYYKILHTALAILGCKKKMVQPNKSTSMVINQTYLNFTVGPRTTRQSNAQN
eukprot:m.137601 g.137601  ORF g.137601 m.137601 type:complete len:316 (+) comp14755_c0_seq3:1365-2312(+)